VDKWVVAADGGVVAEGHFDLTGQLALDGDLDFADGPGDKLMLDGEIDQPASKGLGVEGGSLYARAPSAHRWYLSSLADAGASDAMQLDGLGLRVEGDVRLAGDVEMDDTHGDRIVLRGAKNDPNAMTVGTEAGTLFAKADQRHRWYIGHNRDGGGSDEMELTTTGLTVQGLVNGRSMAADGAKLDGISAQAKNVRVLTGQVAHGGAIFPPAGYSFAQSRVLLSVRAFNPPAFDVNEFGVSARSAHRYAVSPGYLDTLRIRLLRGRALTESDAAGRPEVAVVNRSLARRELGDADPIGQRLRIGGSEDGARWTGVGVVDDVRRLQSRRPGRSPRSRRRHPGRLSRRVRRARSGHAQRLFCGGGGGFRRGCRGPRPFRATALARGAARKPGPRNQRPRAAGVSRGPPGMRGRRRAGARAGVRARRSIAERHGVALSARTERERQPVGHGRDHGGERDGRAIGGFAEPAHHDSDRHAHARIAGL
jgi:hypothetical protein